MSINQFLQQLGTGDTVKDYSHASKLFVGDNYRLAPRQGFLYHVFIDLNPLVKRIGQMEQKEAGMLAKQVDLPKFSIDTKTLNSYNKPNIVQTKIKYDPINITFHDDHADVVRGLWYDYYNYYYRDADLGYQDASGTPNTTYFQNTKYKKRDNNNWGYTPRQQIGADTQYIKAIRLYSLSQKRFAEYTLINPTITAFRHGQHVAGSSEPMQNEMTISFEHVLYAAGWASDLTLNGFADLHYDNTPSPLTPAGGGTRSILGPGGLLAAADSSVTQIGDKNYAGAFFTAFRGYQNLKNMDLKNAAKNELKQLGTDMLRGNNPLNKLFVPNSGNQANGNPIFEVTSKEKPLPPSTAAGSATSNGQSVSKGGGLPALAGVALAGVGAAVLAGKKSGGLALAGGLVLGAGALNKLIKIDPKTGAVEKVGELPNKTSAEAAVAAANGETVSASKNTNPEGATTPATYYEADGSISTTDISQPTVPTASSAEADALMAEAVANAAEKEDPTPLTDAQISAMFADENPNTKLNNDAGVPPTDQNTIWEP